MELLKKSLKEYEWDAICNEVCDIKNATAIRHLLYRGAYVRNVDDFKTLSLDDIQRTCKGIGEMRLEFIKELKLFVEDEEKIQNIWEKNDDLRRFKNNESLCIKVVALRDAGYEYYEISKALGIDKDLAYRIVHA